MLTSSVRVKALLRAGVCSLAVLAGVAVLPDATNATGEAYQPDADFVGCSVSPGGANPTTSATCTPADGGLTFPTRVASAITSTSIPALAVGESITHQAAVSFTANGAYGVSLSTATGEVIACGVTQTLADSNGDLIGDFPIRAGVMLSGTRVGNQIVNQRNGVVSPVVLSGGGGSWFISLTISYAGSGMYNTACVMSGSTFWFISGATQLGSDTITDAQLFAQNLASVTPAGQPLAHSAGQASGTISPSALFKQGALPPVLIDPAGFIYESPNTSIRIPAAVVTIQRWNGSAFVPMDPVADAASMDPDINPEFTNDSGQYKWDVVAGDYRVMVVKTGCTTVTSPTVTIPPPVTDLDIGMVCADADADGLKDWRETNSLVYFSDENTGSAPNDPDSDDDGLNDGAEISLGTNPVDPDYDNDGDLDGADNCVFVPNPDQAYSDANLIVLMPAKSFNDVTVANSDSTADACDPDGDSDNDGLLDSVETPSAPCASATGPTDPKLRDTDGDLVLDGAECALNRDPAVLNPTQPTIADCGGAGDAEPDGVQDYREFCYYNTSASSANTDGDLCQERHEIASINADTKVNSLDLSQVAQTFFTGGYSTPAPAHVADFDMNKDQKINSLDLQFVAVNFATGGCP